LRQLHPIEGGAAFHLVASLFRGSIRVGATFLNAARGGQGLGAPSARNVRGFQEPQRHHCHT
jgi:hypothetical protein